MNLIPLSLWTRAALRRLHMCIHYFGALWLLKYIPVFHTVDCHRESLMNVKPMVGYQS